MLGVTADRRDSGHLWEELGELVVNRVPNKDAVIVGRHGFAMSLAVVGVYLVLHEGNLRLALGLLDGVSPGLVDVRVVNRAGLLALDLYRDVAGALEVGGYSVTAVVGDRVAGVGEILVERSLNLRNPLVLLLVVGCVRASVLDVADGDIFLKAQVA